MSTSSQEPRRRLWIINPMPDENVIFAKVIWESPTAAELLENARDLGYSIRGPYVLEANDGCSQKPRLREIVNEYLRKCENWKEHPEHAYTYMQWEDLNAGSEDRATLPTDLAAMRQIAQEAIDDA